MSLTISLRTALSGLQLNQGAITTTSNNVANANTEGYTRKRIEPVARTIVGIGAGVELGELRRTVDDRLVREIRENRSLLGTMDVKGSYLDRIQDLFGKPADNSSVANRIDALGAAIANLSVTPESETARIDLLNEAERVAQQLRDMSAEVQDLRLEADQEIARAVAVINDQLEAVVRLNAQIGQLKGKGEPTVELEDQRDRAIDTISQYMEINYFERSTGEVVVYTPDGLVLADNSAKELQHDAASVLGPTVAYGSGITGIMVGASDLTNRIDQGEVAGLVQLRDTDLPALQAELDRLTQVLGDEINAVHNRGTGLPAANALEGTRTFADITVDNIVVASDVTFSTLDAGGVVQTTATLPADTYSAEEIRDWLNANLAGVTATVANGTGLTVDATNAAHGVAVADAAGQSVTDGTRTTDSLSHYLGLNDFFVAPNHGLNAAGTDPADPNDLIGLSSVVRVRSDIVDTQQLLSRGALSPTAAVGEVGVSAGDNAVVTELAELFDRELQVPAAGNLPLTLTTLSGYGADILSNAAMEANNAADNKAFQETLSEELDYRRSAVSGVNIDEEMANLILFQNAYSASARVIDVTRRMFDTLESIAR
jgi:flagellar hook-associated protein 1 FlgK